MEIAFTGEEFHTLIDLVSLGDWVLHAYEVEPDERTARHKELIQKIFRHAADFGCGDLVEYDAENGTYHESRAHEEGEKFRHIDEFEENTFWETLISRLAERDFFRETTEGELQNMSPEEKFCQISRQEGKWARAFEENGFERLRLDGEANP